jgi:hypothetical protein
MSFQHAALFSFIHALRLIIKCNVCYTLIAIEVSLLASSSKVSLEINAGKTKYVFLCQQQIAVHYNTMTKIHL